MLGRHWLTPRGTSQCGSLMRGGDSVACLLLLEPMGGRPKALELPATTASGRTLATNLFSIDRITETMGA
jgi:hypothetical protein